MKAKNVIGNLLISVMAIMFYTAPLSGAEATGVPRDVHYVFAHRALPSLLFTRKEGLIKAFENRGQSFVDDLWAAVQKTEEKGTVHTEKEGLAYSKERTGNATIYLVKLPKPARIAEAFFTAVIEKDGKVGYFTLELTAETGGCPFQTILGEWQQDGQHKNHGCGPKADKQDFIREIMAKF